MRRDFSKPTLNKERHSLFDDFLPKTDHSSFTEFVKTLSEGLDYDSWVVILPSKAKSHLVDSIEVQLGSEYTNCCHAVEDNICNGLYPHGTVFATRKRTGYGLTFWFVTGNIKRELSESEVACMCSDWDMKNEFFVKRFKRQKEIDKKRKAIMRERAKR